MASLEDGGSSRVWLVAQRENGTVWVVKSVFRKVGGPVPFWLCIYICVLS